MNEYNYDKSFILNMNLKDFILEKQERERIISESSSDDIRADFDANKLVAKMHPLFQYCYISDVIEHKGAKSFILSPCSKHLSAFRAGQHITVYLDMEKSKVSRPYSISSSPKSVFNLDRPFYRITVKRKENGFASDYILSNWKIGTKVIISSPSGDFYYTRLRDLQNVIAIAGGSGITPFVSMAHAINDGIENFNLTIIYGNRKSDDILFYDELKTLEKESCGKIKIVNVLSEEKKEGFLSGLVDKEIIKNEIHSCRDSFFICGSEEMQRFVEKQLSNLNISSKLMRFEESSNITVNFKLKDVKLTVFVRNRKYEVKGTTTQTIMDALEKSGIRIPSDCRSGSCSLCKTRLISGSVFIVPEKDHRRLAEKKYNWIHPCISFPKEDVSIEVFPFIDIQA